MNVLNLTSARPDPFSTFEFYENYLRNAGPFPAGENLRLWLLLAFNGDEMVGYLALKQRRHRVLGLHAVKLDLLTADRAARPHLVTRPEWAGEVSAAIYAYLLRRKQEWSLLEFQQQDAASALLPLLPAAAALGACRFRQWPNPADGTIAIRWSSIAEYFAALSKKFRTNVRRQIRLLLATGEAQLLTASDSPARAALFELYRGIETHSWKAGTDAAVGRDRRSIEYFDGLMDATQPMRIVIQVLLLDGVPIAGLISGAFAHGLYALHTVYDERLSRFAPGSAIILMGVRQAIEGGYKFLDLLRGFGYYKARWLADMTETRSLQIYRTGTPFFWRRALGDARRRWFAPAMDGESTLFNRAQRGVDKTGTAEMGESPEWVALPGERDRYAALIAQALRGRGEFLTPVQLAAVLPFETRGLGQIRSADPSAMDMPNASFEQG